jgi:hypothetical protein
MQLWPLFVCNDFGIVCFSVSLPHSPHQLAARPLEGLGHALEGPAGGMPQEIRRVVAVRQAFCNLVGGFDIAPPAGCPCLLFCIVDSAIHEHHKLEVGCTELAHEADDRLAVLSILPTRNPVDGLWVQLSQKAHAVHGNRLAAAMGLAYRAKIHSCCAAMMLHERVQTLHTHVSQSCLWVSSALESA